MNIPVRELEGNIRIPARRRGSALLIVLGFLSFMVVSAVSFAIYMRSERMPSSVFRRDVQARHLVKAGLARAISEIDDAIREDPVPIGMERRWAVSVGEGSSSPGGNGLYNTPWMQNYERRTTARYYNRWLGRVFMPPNPDNANDKELMAPSSQTTPVLNLEALGYLPPAVANDVRILSRGTWTAKWKNFDYGAGRYAYCAVDVSDFFDINRVSIATPRTSQDRINIAHLFSRARRVDYISNSDIDAFEKFVHENRGNVLDDYPFVSMMDYNLALGSKSGVAKFRSPFYEWIGLSSSPSDFYHPLNNGNPLGEEDEWIRCKNSCFITDSWFPPEATAKLNISENGREPFLRGDIENENFGLEDVSMASTDFTKFFVKDNHYLSELDKYSLYDYLDRDNEPLSLCIPCVERVPMVAAIQPQVGFKIEVTAAPDSPTGGTGPADPQITETKYKFNADVVDGGSSLNVSIVFPFRHGKGLNGGRYTAKAFMRVYLAELPSGGLYRNDDFALLRPPNDTDPDWQPNSSDYAPFKLGGQTDAFAFTLVSDTKTINLPASVNDENDMLLGDNNGAYQFMFSSANVAAEGQLFFTKQVVQQYTAPGVPSSTPPETKWKLNVKPLSSSAKPLDDGIAVDNNGFMSDADFQQLAAKSLSPCVAVWVRIENSNGEVVDMVPAMPKDDGLNTGDSTAAAVWSMNALIPFNTPPYLLFLAPDANRYTIASSASDPPVRYECLAGPGNWSPDALFTFDPRFNHAPEDWYGGANPSTDLGKQWLQNVQGALGKDGRDEDPFLFVSNQGYLQSLGELAFLPRLSNFSKNDDDVVLTQCRQAGALDTLLTIDNLLTSGGYNGTPRTSIADLSAQLCMWKSYRVFPLGDDGDMTKYGSDGLLRMDGDAIDINSRATDGVHGFRVNPYTTLTNVMFAALANTPYDWWAAGTNKVLAGGVNPQDASVKQNQLSSMANSLKYAFNESGDSDTKLEYKDLRKIATFLMRRFEEAAASGQSWKDMYDNLDWAGTGYTLGNLYQSAYWPSGGWRRQPTLRHSADNSCPADPFKAEIMDTTDNDLIGGTSSSFYDNLTSADRKYLYAFWRNCFAHRQQLFLVFVRAESTAMGGSGEGQIPAQQGGRAVALVWRDPTTPKIQSQNSQDIREGFGDKWVPHRTRVLFYHQFD